MAMLSLQRIREWVAKMNQNVRSYQEAVKRRH